MSGDTGSLDFGPEPLDRGTWSALPSGGGVVRAPYHPERHRPPTGPGSYWGSSGGTDPSQHLNDGELCRLFEEELKIETAPKPRKPQVKRGTQRQQVTRLPAFEPEDYVVIARRAWCQHQDPEACICGRVLRVKSLTASVRRRRQMAEWFAHFENGRCVPVIEVARVATEAEAAEAQAKEQKRGV